MSARLPSRRRSRRRRSIFVPLVLAGLALGAASVIATNLGCATGDPRLDPYGEPPLVVPEAGVDGGDFGIGNPAPQERPECTDETKQIYVLGTDRTLYRFYPEKLSFTRVGIVTCPTTAGTFSMAIDRRGTAWVEFFDGSLFAVDTLTATCSPTAFRPGQAGFQTFGMGFARNGAPHYARPDGGTDAGLAEDDAGGSSDAGGAAGTGTDPDAGETLFVSGAGLASIDTKTFALTFLGSLAYGRTELTSRDTELYAFSVASGVVAGLDKETAATKVVYRTTAVDTRAAFAFAQWGGDFWIFTGSGRSQVTRYSPERDTSSVVVPDTGMLIVGAGSSTCAPTTGPR